MRNQWRQLEPRSKKPQPLITQGLRYKISPYWFYSIDYSITEATRPEPTVRPPSRIAKDKPCSIAIG